MCSVPLWNRCPPASPYRFDADGPRPADPDSQYAYVRPRWSADALFGNWFGNCAVGDAYAEPVARNRCFPAASATRRGSGEGSVGPWHPVPLRCADATARSPTGDVSDLCCWMHTGGIQQQRITSRSVATVRRDKRFRCGTGYRFQRSGPRGAANVRSQSSPPPSLPLPPPPPSPLWSPSVVDVVDGDPPPLPEWSSVVEVDVATS
jgi:hypothetical protein